jgi:hypothetical protein
MVRTRYINRFKFLLISILICFTAVKSHDYLEYEDASLVQEGALEEIKGLKPRSRKKWVFLVYGAADNNLEPYLWVNMKQMELVGSDDDVAILVFACIHKPGQKKLTNKYLVMKDKSILLSSEPGLDSGDPDTFLAACKWAFELYDAEHVAVVGWNHGSGVLNRFLPRGVCYDDTTGNFLTDVTLQDVLSQLDRVIDIFGFDACLMAQIEMAYALRPYVNYMVASQQSIPDVGWPYDCVLKSLKSGNWEPEQFARAIPDCYKAYYKNKITDYTLSALDLSLLDPLVNNIHAVATLLTQLVRIQKSGTVTKAIAAAASKIARFDEPTYGDLAGFYSNLIPLVKTMRLLDSNLQGSALPNLLQFLQDGLSAMSRLVLVSVQGSAVRSARGLSVYLPSRGQSVHPSYYKTLFAATGWDDFLKTYLSSR